MGQFDNKEIPPPLLQVTEDGKPCPMRPDECDNDQLVEPELDGDHRYWECDECGYSWGYERIEEGTRIEGNCSIGVPESVRRQASAPMEQAIAAERQAQPVDLGLTIGRRPKED